MLLDEAISRWESNKGITLNFGKEQQAKDVLDLASIEELDFCVEDHAAFYIGLAARIYEVNRFFSERDPERVFKTQPEQENHCLGNLFFPALCSIPPERWENGLIRYMHSFGSQDLHLLKTGNEQSAAVTTLPGIPVMIILPKPAP